MEQLNEDMLKYIFSLCDKIDLSMLYYTHSRFQRFIKYDSRALTISRSIKLMNMSYVIMLEEKGFPINMKLVFKKIIKTNNFSFIKSIIPNPSIYGKLIHKNRKFICRKLQSFESILYLTENGKYITHNWYKYIIPQPTSVDIIKFLHQNNKNPSKFINRIIKLVHSTLHIPEKQNYRKRIQNIVPSALLKYIKTSKLTIPLKYLNKVLKLEDSSYINYLMECIDDKDISIIAEKTYEHPSFNAPIILLNSNFPQHFNIETHFEQNIWKDFDPFTFPPQSTIIEASQNIFTSLPSPEQWKKQYELAEKYLIYVNNQQNNVLLHAKIKTVQEKYTKISKYAVQYKNYKVYQDYLTFTIENRRFYPVDYYIALNNDDSTIHNMFFGAINNPNAFHCYFNFHIKLFTKIKNSPYSEHILKSIPEEVFEVKHLVILLNENLLDKASIVIDRLIILSVWNPVNHIVYISLENTYRILVKKCSIQHIIFVVEELDHVEIDRIAKYVIRYKNYDDIVFFFDKFDSFLKKDAELVYTAAVYGQMKDAKYLVEKGYSYEYNKRTSALMNKYFCGWMERH